MTYTDAQSPDLAPQPMHTKCPICQSSRFSPFSRTTNSGLSPAQTVAHDRCNNCGLIFMNPLQRANFLGGKGEDVQSPPAWRRRCRQRAETYLATLRNQGITSATVVLDIGSDTEEIGKYIGAALGAAVYGIESSRVDAPTAGCNVAGDDGQEVARLPAADVVLFLHSLETKSDPVQELKRAASLLAPDGVILIDATNADWQPSMSVNHRFCFTRSSLARLCISAGLHVSHSRASGRSSRRFFPGHVTTIARRGVPPYAHADVPETALRPIVRLRHRMVLATRAVLRRLPH